MNRFLIRLMTITLLTPSLFLAACASEVAEIEPESGDAVETPGDEMSEEAESDAAAQGDSDEGAQADGSGETSAESEHRGPGTGMGMGMGMQHDQMQEMMHRQMLSSALEQGLLTEDDVAFFNKIHPIIEAYHPEDAGAEASMPVEAKKSMQRGFTKMAVGEGSLSQEDADRFTAIHDILADSGLMNHEETSSMDDMHEEMHDEHMAEAAAGEALDLRSIMVGLGEATDAINAGIWTQDFDAVAAAADAITNHAMVSAQERSAIQQILGDEFADFGAADHRVHEGGLALGAAAESQDLEAVLAAYAELQAGCVSCHTSFRDRIADR